MLRVNKKFYDRNNVKISKLLTKELDDLSTLVEPNNRDPRSKRNPKKVFKKIGKSSLSEFIFDYYDVAKKSEMLSDLHKVISTMVLAFFAGTAIWTKIAKNMDVFFFFIFTIIIVAIVNWALFSANPKHKEAYYKYVASILIEKGYLKE